MSTNAPTTRLANGDLLPALTAATVGGGTIDLPGDLAGSFGIVLFYRGNWCPFCQTQLAEFQKQLEKFTDANVKVIALSVDSEAEATATVESNSLTFPVGYGLNPEATSATFGNYLSDGTDPHGIYTQATGFIVTPDGRIAVAVYSSSAIGRLTAADTLALVKYAQQQG